MQKITPFLWFDSEAEEAVTFYTSIFPSSSITRVTRYDAASASAARMPQGSVMTIAFHLNGQEFVALNGGPMFEFSESISFVASCENQKELDEVWQKLAEGGKEVQCGWLKDKYGISWQVVPADLTELVSGPNEKGAARAMAALMQMVKIDLAKLREAYEHA